MRSRPGERRILILDVWYRVCHYRHADVHPPSSRFHFCNMYGVVRNFLAALFARCREGLGHL